MDFRTFWLSISASERAGFASRAGSTVGHLNNIAYGYRTAAPDLCVKFERATAGAVTRRDLRPSDWGDIWPELIDDSHPWRVPSESAK